MHRPFPILVLCITVGACRRAPAPEAPTPVPAPTRPTPAVSAPAPAPVPAVPHDSTEREFRGSYTRGFEASWFSPCDASRDDALWWVTLTDEALRQRDSLLRTLPLRPTGALAVRWRGSTSARMPAGMMGRGTRYLLVTRVLEVRPLPPEGACPIMSRTSRARPNDASDNRSPGE